MEGHGQCCHRFLQIVSLEKMRDMSSIVVKSQGGEHWCYRISTSIVLTALGCLENLLICNSTVARFTLVPMPRVIPSNNANQNPWMSVCVQLRQLLLRVIRCCNDRQGGQTHGPMQNEKSQRFSLPRIEQTLRASEMACLSVLLERISSN